MWLEPGPARCLPVVAGAGDASACRPTGGRVHRRVELGALEGEELVMLVIGGRSAVRVWWARHRRRMTALS